VFFAVDFCEPVAEGHLGTITGAPAELQDRFEVGKTYHEIKILCLALDAGVMAKRIATRNQELDPVLGQEPDDVLTEYLYRTPFFHILFIKAHVLRSTSASEVGIIHERA
jgi:hypothetical protein